MKKTNAWIGITVVLVGLALGLGYSFGRGRMAGKATIAMKQAAEERRVLQQRLDEANQQLAEAARRASEADADTEVLLEELETLKEVAYTEDETPKGVTAEEWDRRWEEAGTLRKAGRWSEALLLLQWCYENGDVKGRREKQTSLRRMIELAKVYPPAKEAVEGIRDALFEVGMNAPRSAEVLRAFQDMILLNREMGDHERNLEIMKSLPRSDVRSSVAGMAVYRYLVNEGNFPDAAAAKQFSSMVLETDRWARVMSDSSADARRQKGALMTIGRDVEVLVGAEQTANAIVLLRQTLKVDSSDATQAVLREHLERAGHPELLAAAVEEAAPGP